jgi:hypothetical protein
MSSLEDWQGRSPAWKLDRSRDRTGEWSDQFWETRVATNAGGSLSSHLDK